VTLGDVLQSDHDKLDAKLDEALEETFPASDPPANTVETGVRLEIEAARPPGVTVRDNPAASRFEAVVDGQLAFLQYERQPNAIVIVHTEVPESLRERGIASRLVSAALEALRAEGMPLIVRCPFVRDYLRTHPNS
jgi:predicted GNAT family acetyltransferase